MVSKVHLISFSLTLCLAVIVIISVGCQATGIGATPSKFEFSVDEGCTSQEILYVINTGDTPADYKVYTDDNYSSWVNIENFQFTLAPNANEGVDITFNVPLDSNGTHNFYIYIEGYSAGADSSLGAGLKIPVTIHVQGTTDDGYSDNSSQSTWFWPILFIVIVTAAIILIYHRSRAGKKKEEKNKMEDTENDQVF